MSPTNPLEVTPAARGVTTASVLKLKDNSSNLEAYKTRMLASVAAHGLTRYLSGTARPPRPLKLNTDGAPVKPDRSLADKDNIEEYKMKVNSHIQKHTIVMQQMVASISDMMLSRIQASRKADTSAGMWEELCWHRN
ncbi:hypothetical protein SERLA73DRAFT_127874 [Serpula lacrymans var. lacrymans S7.3]|uniref:Uncharacterized protein n=1 Tax=Serpula lacrymans var. lacrymans (strain S7.3) TaxID=936435 RepID=F8QIA3_SERL3|nr:hypothetical protein SERLA73DRAFT_127874 [Serpula lacrymans var. lacrymans S7.3]